MGYKYKRFYLWGSVSLVAIFTLIASFIDYYYGYEEVVYGLEKVQVKFCLKNGNKNLYFYNKDELPLTFYPEERVSNVEFFKKDGRYKSGYRPINFIDPYYKNRLYVFKISAYLTSCYMFEVEKDWWADVKWTFGELDPRIISGVKVGDKIVKELCEPLYKTWTDEIKYYKICVDCYNITIKSNESDKEAILYPNGTYYKAEEKCDDYSCIDYIDKIDHINEQVDCLKIGKVNVSGKLIQEKDRWCRLIEEEICCMSNIDGGRYGAWYRTDESVDNPCKKVEDI